MFSCEILSGVSINLLSNVIQKKLDELKSNYDWKKLLVDTGNKVLIDDIQKDSLQKELYNVFSEKSLKKIAEKMKRASGREFRQVLTDELLLLMDRFEIDSKIAERFIDHFCDLIVEGLEEVDDTKSISVFISEFRDEVIPVIGDIDKKLDKVLNVIDENIYTIDDIDQRIKGNSIYSELGLDFFEIDDDEFKDKFRNSLNLSQVFIVGNSKEETLYCILNELRKNGFNNVYVVYSESKWTQLQNCPIKGHILVPFFNSRYIPGVQNNINIFIYSIDENCYSENKIILKKRMRKTIVSSLESIGFDLKEAQDLVNNTHGLFVPMKRKLFNGADYEIPKWAQTHTDAVMTALLCGKWTECEGDKEIIEELSGIGYEEFKKELTPYLHNENPYLIKVKHFNEKICQLASVEDAWTELDDYIEDSFWNKFIEWFDVILLDMDPMFNLPFEKHYIATLYAEKPNWSKHLKEGMIRTLIMRAYFRNRSENQRQVDRAVKSILNCIQSKEQWAYISEYIQDLCEASPDEVLNKLEKDVDENPALKELFKMSSDGLLFTTNYYVKILWAIEQLLLQKKYVTRAVRLLWKLDDYGFNYKISNSPKSLLESVFYVGAPISALSVGQKIQLAHEAIVKYSRAWNIIRYELPDCSDIVVSLNKPKFRAIDEIKSLSKKDLNITYLEYLSMCLETASIDSIKWKELILPISYYDFDIQQSVLDQLKKASEKMSDLEKLDIKKELRQIIYNNRFYDLESSSMSEESIELFESAYNEITFVNPLFDFLYIFLPNHEFLLLNPVPYSEDNFDQVYNQNIILQSNEIKDKLNTFKKSGYSIFDLICLSLKIKNCTIGRVLAEYYTNMEYNSEVFDCLLELDENGSQTFDYLHTLYFNNKIDLNKIVEKLLSVNKTKLAMDVIGFECDVENVKQILSKADDGEKAIYWTRQSNGLKPMNEEEYCWILNECCSYGDLDSYILILYKFKDDISKELLYDKFLVIFKLNRTLKNERTLYFFKKVLDRIQKLYKDDENKWKDIAWVELRFINNMDWKELLCLQKALKSAPEYYAYLVCMFNKPNENPELKKMYYSIINKIHFCPAEKDGIVDYVELRNWLEAFRSILKENNLENKYFSIIGGLFTYSPLGSDGVMPCEAVRYVIEEYHSDELRNAYQINELNKRGFYHSSAGKQESDLSKQYEQNAFALQEAYPHTAQIYFDISDYYKKESIEERKLAEDIF